MPDDDTVTLPDQCPDPECDGEIQASSKLFWVVIDGRWVVEDASDEETKLYCSNEHDLIKVLGDDEAYRQLDHALGAEIRELGMQNVYDREQYLIRCGGGRGTIAPQVTDGNAIELIAHMLREPDWGVGMLEDIAEIVVRTGRSLDNPTGEPTWDRH